MKHLRTLSLTLVAASAATACKAGEQVEKAMEREAWSLATKVDLHIAKVDLIKWMASGFIAVLLGITALLATLLPAIKAIAPPMP